MITHKYITRIVIVMMTAALLTCMLAMIFSEKVVEAFGGTGVAVRYESELFDTDGILEIDILMDQEEWEDMLAHAAQETYYSCDVMINNEKIYNVGIRPKGNTSLSSIVMDPDTDRFSLKLEFDRYVEGQTCLGLDKLILNNQYADATNMKEALIYDMYQYLDADASLYNYARISVNGEYWGVYLALEAVEDSFLLRNYGTADGALYKPEGMGMGGGGRDNAGNGRRNGNENFVPPPQGEELPKNGIPSAEDNMAPSDENPRPDKDGTPQSAQNEISQTAQNEIPQATLNEMPQPRKMEGMPDGSFSMDSNGANLNYTDDDLDSYSTIWDGEITNTGKSDHRRVVTALKNISQGTELEKYLDIDNILRYMAVHTFSVNLDSLSGMMAHNYYLYEQDGQLNILPWDYNLSFGGMNMGHSGNDASDVVNDAIDTPFQATRFFDALLENEAYRSKYHEYLKKLTEEYVFGGRFEEFLNRVHNQIDILVQTDPTAFYSYEEYKEGVDMLYQTVLLRAESIEGQLNGSIPSTDEGQQADSAGLVDASSINLEVMGSMGGMGGHGPDAGGRGGRFPEREENKDRPGNGDELTDENIPENGPWEEPAQEAASAFAPNNMPALQSPQGFGQQDSQTIRLNLAVYGVCLLAAVLALLLAKHYRKTPYR